MILECRGEEIKDQCVGHIVVRLQIIPECSEMLSLEPVFGICLLGCYRNNAGSVGRTCSLLQYHSETKEMQLFLVSGH